jgi:hypothetical protein
MARNAYDFYPTPSWCYEKLPINYSKYSTALEPCAGDGRILQFLTSKGLETDYCEIQEGKDFFEYSNTVDLILTNPPYSLAQEFVVHSLSLAPTVIMLLRLNFLGAQKRHTFWKENEPTSLFVLSKRPSFTGGGTDSTEYAWYVWERESKNIQPGVHHIL